MVYATVHGPDIYIKRPLGGESGREGDIAITVQKVMLNLDQSVNQKIRGVFPVPGFCLALVSINSAKI